MSTSLYWLRQDFRLHDNPALSAAAKSGKVLCVYIHDTSVDKELSPGEASQWWLHHALKNLDFNINIYEGRPIDVLTNLCNQYDCTEVFWNRCYAPHEIQRDKLIKSHLEALNIKATSSNGHLLWEPWTIHKQDGGHYRVFTPFYRKGCLQATEPRQALLPPTPLETIRDSGSLDVDDLNLLPTWHQPLMSEWDISESGAHHQLKLFLEHGIHHYKEGRNLPAKPYISRLSPYLRWGHISPNQIWHTVTSWQDDANVDTFCSELGWREFSYHLLYHYPDIRWRNLQSKFDVFPWQHDADKLKAWQTGQTGIPMVDAGMRELYQTGFMHNRVRMITASFLVKNLLLHWHHGERWFWDCLLDADPASNSASWQWVAGCGADAAPYFRIFNPVTQAEKFDPEGEYIRRFIPELKALPTAYLFAPWTAPPLILQQAGVQLGTTYPRPIVDLKQSRLEALEALKTTKASDK